jgi:hypothetical protein
MFKFISMSCSKLDLLEFATSVNGHHVFLCSSWYQCHAWSLIFLNLLQVLMVIMFFYVQVDIHVFEFVTSVNSHHVVFMFKFTPMLCLKPHLLEICYKCSWLSFFLCSKFTSMSCTKPRLLDLLQVLMVVMCLNSLQCNSNNASICCAWCYYIV